MKYVMLFEEFIVRQEDVLDDIELDNIELSDKNIDDVLKPDLFEREDLDESGYIDQKGVIHIKNWNQY